MDKKSLFEHLSIVRDFRQDWKVDHKLTDILFLTVCAVIGGADGWDEIEDFGQIHESWFRARGEFEQGIPSRDTIRRVMSKINPAKLQQAFIAWMKTCHELTGGDIVAIDGKTLRRSFSKEHSAIHMVSAFSVKNSIVLGQVKTEEKSNEITAIPELLELLDISGCLVTLDAMGCQTKIANKIIESGADYLLAVKGNQGRLEEAFIKHFPMSTVLTWSGDSYVTTNKIEHGRQEQRLYITRDLFDDFVDLGFEWRGMKTLGVSMYMRSKPGEKPNADEVVIRYYISSRALSAEQFAESIRSHWHVENKLHYKLDVGFNEDQSRIRADDGAENFARIRHMCISLLSNEKTFKGGVKRKRKMAGMSEEYLEKVLAAL
ncbi:ISAs1 family transposase [Vibrio cincinnatiensis]|uniref:ISAs1 family transposase n=1 Tax=Vibrio cincinnatiensis TaxID=675 RepID=UPI0012AD149B|nr:ISAs1 family transposase [Vibrio cincinnatiensis]